MPRTDQPAVPAASPAPRWAMTRVASATETAHDRDEQLSARAIARRTGLSVGLVKRCLASLPRHLTIDPTAKQGRERGASS